jgi:hypothetical protein
MLKRFTHPGLLIIVLTAGSLAQAQTGLVSVYFDKTGRTYGTCEPFAIDTLAVVATGWNMELTAIQFRIQYPPSILWIVDFNTQLVTLGATPNGIATGWPTPQNGFEPILVCNVLYQWNCNNCSSHADELIRVLGHPLLGGTVSATRASDNALIDGAGWVAVVCPTQPLPVERSTWSRVKALYRSE